MIRLDREADNSFANRQERIDHGVLLRWTKGFGAAGVEGQDVVEMFKKSLKKNVSQLAWAFSCI